MGTATSGQNIYTTGRIQASDLNDIANHFRQWFSVSYTAPSTGTRINASDFNNLRQALLNGAGTAYTINGLPGTVTTGQRIVSTTWGYASANFSSETITYTSSSSFTVPVGCNSMTINQLLGGGGGGAWATALGSGQNGADCVAVSGGGGSGGFNSNVSFSVTGGDIVTINIGNGGTGGTNTSSSNINMTNGGDSSIQLNGNTILISYGGSAGNAARATGAGAYTTASGGAGGSPNGNSGGTPTPASSPYSNGYGAGGAGAKATSLYLDLSPVGRWSVGAASGAGGAGGYASITYNP